MTGDFRGGVRTAITTMLKQQMPRFASQDLGFFEHNPTEHCLEGLFPPH